MAHFQQSRYLGFVKEEFPEYFKDKRVLEIGSLDINGSARSLFEDCRFTGIDVAAGKGVDLIVGGQDFAGSASSMDVVISCECFEHNPEYEKTWLNMIRVLRPDGLMILTCATLGRRQHGTTLSSPESSPLTVAMGQDYYRNLIAEDLQFVDLKHFFVDHFFVTDHSSSDLYFLGLGKSAVPDHVNRFAIAKSKASTFYRELGRAGLM